MLISSIMSMPIQYSIAAKNCNTHIQCYAIRAWWSEISITSLQLIKYYQSNQNNFNAMLGMIVIVNHIWLLAIIPFIFATYNWSQTLFLYSPFIFFCVTSNMWPDRAYSLGSNDVCMSSVDTTVAVAGSIFVDTCDCIRNCDAKKHVIFRTWVSSEQRWLRWNYWQ